MLAFSKIIHEYKWSKWTNLPANKILDHVRDKVFPFLRTLGGENSLYAQYMKDAVFTIPTASLLIEAVKIIDDMHIKEQNRDAKGDLYEYLLSALKDSWKEWAVQNAKTYNQNDGFYG